MQSVPLHLTVTEFEDKYIKTVATYYFVNSNDISLYINKQLKHFRFSSSTRHMFLHEKTSTLSLPSVLELQSSLNMLNSTIFPQLHMPKQQIEDYKSENHILAKPFMKYSYRPKKIVSL